MVNDLDVIGKRFGKLTILKYSFTKNYRKYYLCKCDCGNEKNIYIHSILRGSTRSCGCIKGVVHGMYGTRFYTIWQQMKDRCSNKNNNNYHDYGDRGITVCDRWKNSFLAFKEDMYESYLKHCEEHGEKNTSIDRIDVDGNYEPNNCRWATLVEQNNNKRNTLYYTDGMKLVDVCIELGVDYELVKQRMYNGMDMDEALSKPKRGSIMIDGVKLLDYCKNNNLNYKTIISSTKRGWNIEKALTEPIQKRGDEY